MQQAIVDAGLPLLAAAATAYSSTSWEPAGDLQVLGGTQGIDWRYTSGNVQYKGADYGTSNVLEILTSTPLTVKNAAGKATSTTTIQINAGVKADLTLADVNITSVFAPINIITNSDEDGDGVKIKNGGDIKNKTMLYLTIADSTTNILESTDASASGWPGIRCGWGSILCIDDEITNVRAGGSKFNLDDIVTPSKGAVPSDLTLLNGKELKAGDPLGTMESAKPGILEVYSGGQSAAIGSPQKENAGTLIFNGGNVMAHNGAALVPATAGATIGGGNGGSGTVITINGGYVSTDGGSCGSGIGCGLSYCVKEGHYGGAHKPDAIPIPEDGTDTYSYGYSWYGPLIRPGLNSSTPGMPHYQAVAGDITINGGFADVTGPYHGNAIGISCQHGAANNLNHLIRITGGTLITNVPNAASTNPYMFSIGATYGYTLVTGGSVFVQTHPVTTEPMFQGLGGTAYNTQNVENWSDVVSVAGGQPNDDLEAYHLPDQDKVFMITINLTKEIEKRNIEAGITNDPNFDDRINSWKLLIGGKEYNYGSPDRFYKGELYLWLPESALKKEVTVDLSYTDKNGDEQVIEPLFRDPAHGATGNTLKRYVKFDIPADMASKLTKYYDGLPLEGLKVSETSRVPTDDGKELSDQSCVSYKYQLYDAVNGSPLGVESDSSTSMPVDEGIMKLTIDSNQWQNTEGFKESYWGHRAIGWCEIKPVPSKVAAVRAAWADGSSVTDPMPPSATLDIEVDVTSGDGTATTCKAPTGHVQLYVDGAPAGSPVEIKMSENAHVATDASGREHTVVSWSFPAGSLMSPAASHTISAKYLPLINYLESATPGEKEPVPSAEVIVRPDPKTPPKPSVAKAVENLTHPDGPTQAGDRLRYTITAMNSAAGSLWMSVALTDALPACLTLDSTTLHLSNPWEKFDGKPLTGDGTSLGSWSLSAPGANGRRTLSVGAGNIAGGNRAVLTFECTVDPAAVREGATAEELGLTNVAEATGTRPDPNDPDNPMPNPDDPDNPIPVTPGPSAPVTPPGGDKAAPADPDIKIAKTVTNVTSPLAKETKIGSILRYEIVLENTGDPSSCLIGALISDPMPTGIELASGTMKMTLPDGTVIPVSDEAYDAASRTIAVTAGDLWGGRKVALAFEALVTEAAVGQDTANIAYAHGTIPSTEPGPGSQPTGDEPGKPADPPNDEPVAQSSPASPSPVAGLAAPTSGDSNGKNDGSSVLGAIKTRLAKTGDPMWMLLASTGGAAVGALLLVGAAALALRRTRRAAQ